MPIKKKQKKPIPVTGNSPGCFSITDRESTQGASFPILQLKKLQLRSSELRPTVTQHGSGRLRKPSQVSRCRSVFSTPALSARGSQAAPTQGPPAWPGHTLLQPLPHLSHRQGREDQGRGPGWERWTQSGWEPPALEPPDPVSPRPLPAACGHTDGQASRLPSPVLTLQALSAAWPLPCLQQSTSWKTTPQQRRWGSSTFWPLRSHNRIWREKALTLMSSCQQPGTRPTSSTALDPRPKPAVDTRSQTRRRL